MTFQEALICIKYLQHTQNEKAIAGITTGLISLNEFVTWQARHFGINQQLTSKITAFERPKYFRDEQQEGPFKFITHDHSFTYNNGEVLMKDVFKFQSPFGPIGSLIDKFVMTGYLKKLLIKRNDTIKEYAESEKWKPVLLQ